MTDHDPAHDEPDRVDALASAVLDGLVPADEAAAARRDPAVARRIEQMAAARDALRAVPPPVVDRREAAIAAALAAAPPAGATSVGRDPWSGDAVPPAPPLPAGPGAPGDRRPPPPASLQAARDRRARRLGPRWLGTAAAVLLVLGLVGLVASVTGSSGDGDAADQTSAAAPEESSGPDDAGGSAGAGEDRATADRPQDAEDSSGSSLGAAEAPDAMAESAPGAAPTTAPPVGTPQDGRDDDAVAVELGTHATEADLAAAARQAVDDPGGRVAADEASPSAGVAVTRSCPVPAAVRPADGSPALALVGGATLAGEPVGVWVGEVGGTPRLVAADAGCTVVVDRPLPG
jgi:hypothetical protein